MRAREESADRSAVVLEAHDLVLGYSQRRRPERVVAGPLGLEVLPGRLVCLLGPNGAGKSTLLRTLAGMQFPLAGTVYILGRELTTLSPPALARRLSVVLTGWEPLGNLTARMLVSLGRYPYTDWMGRLTSADWECVDEALDALSATDLAHRRVAELSDGERQKVLVARALAQEPRLMILDEPTSFLDLPRRIEMLALLRRLTRTRGCSVVLATHHLDLALHYGDELWLQPLNGPFQSGAPEDLALSGALEATFATAGLVFDAERGEFRFAPPTGGPKVSLGGDGIGRVWARHALRREGYEVIDEHVAGALPLAVEAEARADGNWSWRWHNAEGSGREKSIAELLKKLRGD